MRTIAESAAEYSNKGLLEKPPNGKTVRPSPRLQRDGALPSDVKALQAGLRKARLQNEVLQEVTKIAEEELGVPIREKAGTRQS